MGDDVRPEMEGMLGVTWRPVVITTRRAWMVCSELSEDPRDRLRMVARCGKDGSPVRCSPTTFWFRLICGSSLKCEAYEWRYSTKLGKDG